MKKKISFSIFIAFWILFLEMIYKIFIFHDFFEIDTLLVILFSIPWIVIISFILSLFNEKWNRIVSLFFVFLITLVTLAQIVYYNFYNSIFSFFSLTTGTGQVMHFWQAILEIIARIWYVFAIVIIPYVLYILFNKKVFNYKHLNAKKSLIHLVILIISVTSIFSVINLEQENIYSLKRLIFETHAPMITANKIGLLSTQALDIERYTFGFEEKIYEEKNYKEVELEPKIEYNILDINYDELIKNTTDKKLLSLHKYFNSVEPTKKNNYTGLFKGKNLIFITAESFDTIAINEKVTPTLYKMANNSFVFTNFYQPLYPVSTSDGEYMNLMSLVPKEGSWSFKKTSNLSMPMAFGNMFKKNGYTSYAFHNYSYNYYSRNQSHKNIGFTYYGCGNGLEKKMNCSHWPNSDDEMIKSTMSYYMDNSKPFATYYMTVSGHLNYNFYGNSMAARNKKYVKNLKYSEAAKAYLATQKEFDKSLSRLLKELEKNNKLDDTLIIISPDHYPYGLTFDQLNELSNINRKDKFENYHTSLIIYNPSIEKTIVNKTISSMDILPTIYNLYGLNYDSRLLMGKDIFSDSESIVILSDRSWITSKGRYNTVNNKFIKTTDEEVSQEYIESINKEVNKKFSISSLILDTNYYKKVGLK